MTSTPYVLRNIDFAKNIKDSKLLSFMKHNKHKLVSAKFFKREVKTFDGVDYVTSINIHAPSITESTTIFFSPKSFMTNEEWDVFFVTEDKYLASHMVQRRYIKREVDSLNKYNVTSAILKDFFKRNSPWKLAIHSINKDRSEHPHVIPMSIKNGKITKLIITKNSTTGECINYLGDYAPSVKQFLELYEEYVEEKPASVLREEDAEKIIDKFEEYRERLMNSHFSWDADPVRESFKKLVLGFVK
ncbi:hypothetical protein [Erwinia phage FBB1]|nr:hypothetical protein [Erwinia phage FBB1]